MFDNTVHIRLPAKAVFYTTHGSVHSIIVSFIHVLSYALINIIPHHPPPGQGSDLIFPTMGHDESSNPHPVYCWKQIILVGDA